MPQVPTKLETAILKRVGMRCEGHFVKSLWFKNNWANELWFAILRDEW